MEEICINAIYAEKKQARIQREDILQLLDELKRIEYKLKRMSVHHLCLNLILM